MDKELKKKRWRETINQIKNEFSWCSNLGLSKEEGTVDCLFCKRKGKAFIKNNYYRCFSSHCEIHGDPIKIYQLLNDLDFSTAVKELSSDINVRISNYRKEYQERNDFLKYVMDVFEDQLKEHPEVIDYLEERGINSSFHRLGYAPNKEVLMSYNISSEDLIKHKLLDDIKRPLFRNRIMIPIYNRDSYMVHLTGRSLEESNDSVPKYLDTKAMPLFGSSKDYLLYEEHLNLYLNNPNNDTLYLVEGVMDSLTMYQTALPTVGSLGLGKLREKIDVFKHSKIIDNKERNFKRIVAIFDSDKYTTGSLKGKYKSWEKVIPSLVFLQKELGTQTQILLSFVPLDSVKKGTKDINDFYNALNRNSKALVELIEHHSIDLVEYIVNKEGSLLSQHQSLLELIKRTDRGKELFSSFIPSSVSTIDYLLSITSS